MIRLNSKYNTLLKTSEKFERVSRIKESTNRIEYTIIEEYDNFKSVILNRSIFLSDSFSYIIFNYSYNELIILLLDDKGYTYEYATDYDLLPNTTVSLEVEQDNEDGKYSLYIDISPIQKIIL